MNIIETKLELCLQPNLQHPSAINPRRNEFHDDYIKYGFDYVLKKYTKKPLKIRFKNWLKEYRIVNYFWKKYKKLR